MYKLIMKEFSKKVDKTLTAYELTDLLNRDQKQINRYMESLQSEFHNIIKIKVGRKNGYKLICEFILVIEHH